MNILVTGAKGFVGKNLCENLKNIRDGKNKTRNIQIDDIYECTRETKISELEYYCTNTDFVFDFAGVMRPKDVSEFYSENLDFTQKIIDLLKEKNNKCPIMLSSSIQATLLGRFAGSEYGKSKLAAENAVFQYGKETGQDVFVYRFPNLFGKWCKPNYNSVIATFCNNIANDLPITINDPSVELELLYIDDVIDGMLSLLENKVHHCTFNGINTEENKQGKFCFIPCSNKVTLGRVVELLNSFKYISDSLIMPELPNNSFEKKLFSTFVSYYQKTKTIKTFKMNKDDRGSFTELIKTDKCGQFSVNVSKPGIVKGEHWHNSKWELFIVVSGHALIQQRKIGNDEIWEFEVSDEKIQAVYMLPGYAHNIINLSKTENLVTLMWANEQFDKNHPDTFGEKVK